MLVEEPHVDVEDPVADDAEAEVAGLDHAGVDRPDRDVVRVVAAHADRPAVEREVVVDERPQRLVAVEADAVEVVRLALVPARGGARSTIDGTAPPRASTVSSRPCRRARPARGRRAPVGRVEAPEARAGGERGGDRLAVGAGSRTVIRPPDERLDEVAAGEPERRHCECEEHRAAAVPSTITPRRPGASSRSRRRVLPPVVSTSAWARPRKPRASRTTAAAAAHGRTRLEAAGDDQHLADEERRRRKPASAPSERPIVAPSAGCVRAMPVTACPAARGSCPRSGVAA